MGYQPDGNDITYTGPQHTVDDDLLIWLSKPLVRTNNMKQNIQIFENTIDDFNSKKKRSGASVNAYLVLKKENKVLLHLRNHTGYCDGFYGLVSGHVEDAEPATSALIREAREEAGIQLDSLHLHVAHVMHRKTDRLNIDIFFECSHWQGDITNREPEKCVSLDFFSMDNLPSNTINYIKDALQAISANEFYSEVGWT